MESDTVRRITEELADIEEASDLSRPEWMATAKRRCLENMLARAKDRQRLTKPEVFVSFTGQTGQEIMTQVARRINSTKAPGTNVNFHASSGMDQRGDSQPQVLPHIIEKIKPCCLFVGILTREWEIAAKEGSGEFGPGGWALIETGMALSMGLDVLLFIDKAIKEEFWRLYLGHVRNVWFEPNSYVNAIGSLMKRIEEAYRGLQRNGSTNRWL